MSTDMVRIDVNLAQREVIALEALGGGSIEEHIARAIAEYDKEPHTAPSGTYRVFEGSTTTVRAQVPR